MEGTRKNISGVIVPMVTPLNEDLSLDIHSVSKILKTFTLNEISTFILGTTGESVSIPYTLRTELVKATVKERKGKMMVYAGIAGNCLQESIDTGNQYASFGVDAVVIHLPFFFPVSDDSMIRYFKSVADHVKCPVILYNNPVTARWSIPLHIVDKLSNHPNIIGFKDSENSIERINTATKLWANRLDFSYLMGCAVHSAYALGKGCDGIVPSAGNLVPELYQKLYKAAVEGKTEITKKYQLQTNIVSDIYQQHNDISRAIPALKIIMSEYGLCKPFVMPPLYELDHEKQMKLKLQIREALNTLSNVTT